MKKRLLSAFLSLAMLGSTFLAWPVAAGAEDTLLRCTVDFSELEIGKVSAAEADLAKKDFSALNLLFKHSWEPASGFDIAAGGLEGKKAADDKYMKISGEKTDSTAEIIGMVRETDRNIKGRSLHVSFDIAVSDLNTSRYAYVAESAAGASQLVLFQSRGDNSIAIAGNKIALPIDGGGVLPGKWYNFVYEIIPAYTPNVTIVKAWVNEKYIGYVTSDKLPNAIFERIGIQQANYHENFADGDYTCIDNISVEVREPAAATLVSKADYTVDFQELSEGPVTRAELQKAKDGWDNLKQWYNNVESDEHVECVGGVFGKSADDMALKFTVDDTILPEHPAYFQLHPKAADKTITAGDTINVSFEIALDTFRECRTVHFRGASNNDRVILFQARGDGVNIGGNIYRGFPTATGALTDTWYKFDFEIQPGIESTGRKTVIKSWLNGEFIGRSECDVLDQGKFDWLYLEVNPNGMDGMLGAATYMDNIKYQVVSADNTLRIENENKQIYVTDAKAYASVNAKVSSLGAWMGRGFENVEILKDGAAAAADDRLMDCVLRVTRLNGISYTIPFCDENDMRTTFYENSCKNAAVSGSTVDGLYANFGTQTTAAAVNGVAGKSEKDSCIRIATKTAEGETLDSYYAPWFNIQDGAINSHLSETLTLGMSVLVDDPNGDGRFRYQIGDGGFGDYIYVYNDHALATKTNKTIYFKPGEWVRLETVIHPDKVMEFYINGEYAGEYQDTLSKYVRFRFEYYIGGKGNVDSAFYVDDIYIGYGTPKKYAPAADMLRGSSNPDVVEAVAADRELLTNGTATVGEALACLMLDGRVSAVRVYTDRTMAAAAADEAVLKTGDVMVFTDGTDYLYYDVYAPGEGYERTAFQVYANGQPADGTFAAGSVSAQAKYSTYTSDIPEQIIIAQYSPDNRLIGVAVSARAQMNGEPDRYKTSEAVLEANLAVTGEADTQVKVMLWDAQNMRPLIAEPVALVPADT